MNILARDWWTFTIRGVIAILFGFAAIFWPALTLGALVLLFGAYVLVDGIFALGAAIRAMQHKTRWWPLLLQGLAGVAAGILTFVYPGITTVVLLVIIAAWAIVSGIGALIAAIELRRYISNEWLLGLSGVASILFGIILFAQPGAGALALIWVIGIYAIVFGVLELGFSFRLRGFQEAMKARTSA